MRISDWSSDVCSSDLYDGNLEVFIEKRLSKNVVMRLTGTNLLDADSLQAEAGFDGDHGAEIIANQAAYAVDAYAVERELGRALCRERVGQSGSISVAAVSLKKKQKKSNKTSNK